MPVNDIIILIIIGVFAGFLSGSMGIGGGIIIVPALIFFFGISQHEAQGTSLGILVFPVAIAGAYNYYKEGYINTKFVFIILFAFLVGGYFGSLLSVNLPDKVLKKVFGILILLIGIKMVFSK